MPWPDTRMVMTLQPPGPQQPYTRIPPPTWTARKVFATIALIAVPVLCACGLVALVVDASRSEQDPLREEIDAYMTALTADVQMPDSVLGRPRSTDRRLQAPVNEMIASLRQTNPDMHGVVGGAYGDPANGDLLTVIAGKRTTMDPDAEAERLATGLAAGDPPGLTTQPIAPGPLGGAARCGDTAIDKTAVGVCVWMDVGTFGVVAMHGTTASELEAKFAEVRGAVQRTG